MVEQEVVASAIEFMQTRGVKYFRQYAVRKEPEVLLPILVRRMGLSGCPKVLWGVFFQAEEELPEETRSQNMIVVYIDDETKECRFLD